MVENLSHSKKITKTDEAAKELIIEILGFEKTGGFDVDSIYKLNNPKGWVVLEFLKCDTVRPFESHPRRYWFKNKQKFISLWELTTDLKGILYLINYEDSREQFLLLKVNKIDSTIYTTDIKMNYTEFKNWLIELNREGRKR